MNNILFEMLFDFLHKSLATCDMGSLSPLFVLAVVQILNDSEVKHRDMCKFPCCLFFYVAFRFLFWQSYFETLSSGSHILKLLVNWFGTIHEFCLNTCVFRSSVSSPVNEVANPIFTSVAVLWFMSALQLSIVTFNSSFWIKKLKLLKINSIEGRC